MHLKYRTAFTPKELKFQCDQETKDKILGKQNKHPRVQIIIHSASTKDNMKNKTGVVVL